MGLLSEIVPQSGREAQLRRYYASRPLLEREQFRARRPPLLVRLARRLRHGAFHPLEETVRLDESGDTLGCLGCGHAGPNRELLLAARYDRHVELEANGLKSHVADLLKSKL